MRFLSDVCSLAPSRQPRLESRDLPQLPVGMLLYQTSRMLPARRCPRCRLRNPSSANGNLGARFFATARHNRFSKHSLSCACTQHLIAALKRKPPPRGKHPDNLHRDDRTHAQICSDPARRSQYTGTAARPWRSHGLVTGHSTGLRTRTFDRRTARLRGKSHPRISCGDNVVLTT